MPSPMGASGQGWVRDGVCRVAGEGHGDGVARPPRHFLHAVEVLRAGGEERDSSWTRKESEGLLGKRRGNGLKEQFNILRYILIFCLSKTEMR